MMDTYNDMKRLTIDEMVFCVLCIVTILFKVGYGLIIALPLIVIALAWNRSYDNELEIRPYKKHLKAFIITFFLYIVVVLFITKYHALKIGGCSPYIYQIGINSTLIVAIIMGTRLKDFNWKMSIKSVVLIVLVLMSIELMQLAKVIMAGKTTALLKNILICFPLKVFFPSIIEEVLYRGLMLGGLLAIGIRMDRANIMQSILFGIVHVVNDKTLSLDIILMTSLQVYVGFLLGKVYLNTKSLTPCIILHALIDCI